MNVDFNDFPFQTESVNVITAFNVIEHIENPFHFIRESARVLKKEGILVFSVPNNESLWARLNYMKNCNITSYTLNNNHLTFFTRNIFKKIVLRKFKEINRIYGKGFVPRFSKIVMPPHQFFSKNVCYFLQKI
ncbi:class I SAM-dependent methyltransferase [Patescibacteria group bacterium]|nr:class I SAM-dependent methyltransferase [Patescibacteria group bacterium]